MPTIKTALAEATVRLDNTSESPRADAEILLCKILAKTRSYLRAWPDRELTGAQIAAFISLIEKRQEGQPVAYLTGIKEFWSRDFLVNPDVLIPRPETELIVELSLERIPPNRPSNILDLGTGSGIIGITLAKERPQAEVWAVDISNAALALARHNALQLQAGNINFIESRWFDAVPHTAFDLIVSNPPYVAAIDPHLTRGDLRFEPQTALIAGNKGMADIEHIVNEARSRLKADAFLLLEHGYNQQNAVQAVFQAYHYQSILTFTDLANQPRVTQGHFVGL